MKCVLRAQRAHLNKASPSPKVHLTSSHVPILVKRLRPGPLAWRPVHGFQAVGCQHTEAKAPDLLGRNSERPRL